MPTEIKVIISDAGFPYVKAALDSQNVYQTNAALPLFTMETFIQSMVEGMFGISDKEIEGRIVGAKVQEIVGKISPLDIKKLEAISAAVDAEIGAVHP